MAIGEFHGVIAATTPIGSCTLIVTKSPREGVMRSSSVSSAAAKIAERAAALATSARVSLIGLPLSRRCICASASCALADQIGDAMQHGRALMRLQSAPSPAGAEGVVGALRWLRRRRSALAAAEVARLARRSAG